MANTKRNLRAARAATKQAEKPAEKTAAQKAAEKLEPFKALAGHVCEVTKGIKFDHGRRFNVVEVGLNRKWNRPYAKAFEDGETIFVDPTNLKPVEPIPAKKLAVINSEIEAAKEETFLIDGTVRKDGEKAILLSYSKWFQPLWLPKAMVTKIGDMDNGLTLFEIPAWKVRNVKDGRPYSVEHILSEQERLEKIAEKM